MAARPPRHRRLLLSIRFFATDLGEFILAVRAIDTRGRTYGGNGRGGDLGSYDEWIDLCLANSEGMLDIASLRTIWDQVRVLPRGDTPDVMNHGDLIPPNVPHMEQALRTQEHLEQLGNGVGDITGVIDAIRHGIVIVGSGCGVVHLNSAAERILTSGDGLCIRSGRVEATRVSTNTELQVSITRACVEPQNGSRSGDSFACSRPPGKRPYVIHVLPLTAAENPSAARALLMIIDPEQESEPLKMLIRRLFGLTNAEADVALRVLCGDGLKPISADLTLSMATVKTHLHHIFSKTDTHRQAELVRLLLAIIP